jgi:hypothetical protein
VITATLLSSQRTPAATWVAPHVLRPCARAVLAFAVGLAIWHATALVAGATAARSAEVLSCGGGFAGSASRIVQQTVAQGPVGSAAAGGVVANDGFWFVAPSANTLVEGALFGTLTENGTALISWWVASVDNIVGFNVYRSTSRDGAYSRVNDSVLPPEPTGSYEDATVWPETIFWYQIRAVLSDGTEDVLGGYQVTVSTGGRLALRLYPAHPNPSSGVTALRFELPGHAGDVRLEVYTADGRRVRSLVDGAWVPGRHEVVWDGRDASGNAVASGVYFARLATEDDAALRKVLVVR